LKKSHASLTRVFQRVESEANEASKNVGLKLLLADRHTMLIA